MSDRSGGPSWAFWGVVALVLVGAYFLYRNATTVAAGDGSVERAIEEGR